MRQQFAEPSNTSPSPVPQCAVEHRFRAVVALGTSGSLQIYATVKHRHRSLAVAARSGKNSVCHCSDLRKTSAAALEAARIAAECFPTASNSGRLGNLRRSSAVSKLAPADLVRAEEWHGLRLEDVDDVVFQRLGICAEDRLDTVADLDDTGGPETLQTRLIHLALVGDLHAQASDAGVDVDEVLPAAERRDDLLGLAVGRDGRGCGLRPGRGARSQGRGRGRALVEVRFLLRL